MPLTPPETRVPDNESHKFRRPRQARGREKFEKILDAADTLIADSGTADGLSLYDIAEKAGVAVGSVYHFFPSSHAVLVALIERYDRKFEELVDEPMVEEAISDWRDVLWLQTERSRRYINATPGALIMILGSGQTWATRIADAKGDAAIAASMVTAIEHFFRLPASPDPQQIVFNAIRMLESLWATSYLQYDSVTDDYAAETHKAICAYLALYWPPYLERIEQAGLEK
jgi:AcrR family transcriptional regulator